MSETKGVQEYYAAIRSRLTNYINARIYVDAKTGI